MLSSAFHDERLISITVTNDTLVMALSLGEKAVKIKLDGLEKLRVTDFKEGNIIHSINVINRAPTTNGETEVKSLLMYAYDLDDNTLKGNIKLLSFMRDKLAEHANGALTILELVPSYGAYMVAIGRTVSEESTDALE